jgi:hypothetical protein
MGLLSNFGLIVSIVVVGRKVTIFFIPVIPWEKESYSDFLELFSDFHCTCFPKKPFFKEPSDSAASGSFGRPVSSRKKKFSGKSIAINLGYVLLL